MIDFNLFEYESGKPTISNDEEYVAQQIEMLFNTEPNSVLGDDSYGTNYDRYVYGISISNTALESKVMGDLQRLDLRGLTPKVTVTFVEGTVRDIALIDIQLGDQTGDVVFNKTFMIN